MGQKAVDPDPHQNWEDEKHNAKKTVKRKTTEILRYKKDFFKGAGILSEEQFDAQYEEYRLFDSIRRGQHQAVRIITNPLRYDDPAFLELPITYKLDDPIDAAIFLRSPETDVIFQAMEALIAFTEGRLSFSASANAILAAADQHEEEGDIYFKATLVNEPGFLARVVELITHPRQSICRRAVILFGSLSRIEETLLLLEDANLTNVFSLMILETEPVILDWLSLALRNLSVLPNVQLIFLDTKFIQTLLDLALYDNQDPDVVENAAESLCNLCSSHEIREFLVFDGGFEVAVELALSEFPSTQYQALRLMRGLLVSPVEGAVDRFHEADGMATIMSLINAKEFQFLHASALEILEQLMGIPSIATVLSHEKIYDYLLDMALSKDYQETDTVQTFALRCVARAAHFPDERLLMSNCGAESKILQLLKLKSLSVQKAALEAIGFLASTLNCRRRLNEQGVVKQTCIFLKSRDPQVRSAAYFAVGSLMAQDFGLQEEYLKEGFMECLLGALDDDRGSIHGFLLSHAMQCAINLSETEATRKAMETAISKHLTTWLTDPCERVKNKALAIAVLFLKKDEARIQFANQKGFEAIAKILQEDCTDEVMRNVCWAISSLAIQKSSVFSLVKSGCIFKLLEASREKSPVTSGTALLALQTLSRIHLPFKLALFDKLDPGDRVNHGFYDMGTLAGNQSMTSLRNLLKIRPRSGTSAIPVAYVCLPKKKFVSAESKVSAAEDGKAPEDLLDMSPRILSPVSGQSGSRKTLKGFDRKVSTPVLQVIECDPANENLRKVLKSSARRNSAKASRILEGTSQVRPGRNSLVSSKSSFPVKYKIQKDRELTNLIRQMVAETQNVHSVDKEIKIIARLVAARMGNHETAVKSHLKDLMKKYKSICIPLGSISQGSSYYRAYLFKVLADRIHLPVSFQRGPYGSGFNEIVFPQPAGQICVIDLIAAIGTLIPKESEEGTKYLEFLQTAEQARMSENLVTAEPVVNVACRYDPNATSAEADYGAETSPSEVGKPGTAVDTKEPLEVLGHTISVENSVNNIDGFPSELSFVKPATSEMRPMNRWMSLTSRRHPAWKRLRAGIAQEIVTASELASRKAVERKAAQEVAMLPPNTREKLSVLPQASTQPPTEKLVKAERKKPFSRWSPGKTTFKGSSRTNDARGDAEPKCENKFRKSVNINLHDPSEKATVRKNLLDSSSDSEDFDWEGYSKKDRKLPSVVSALPKPSATEIEVPEKEEGWDVLTKSEQRNLERWEMDFEEDDFESSQSDEDTDERTRKPALPLATSRKVETICPHFKILDGLIGSKAAQKHILEDDDECTIAEPEPQQTLRAVHAPAEPRKEYAVRDYAIWTEREEKLLLTWLEDTTEPHTQTNYARFHTAGHAHGCASKVSVCEEACQYLADNSTRAKRKGKNVQDKIAALMKSWKAAMDLLNLYIDRGWTQEDETVKDALRKRCKHYDRLDPLFSYSEDIPVAIGLNPAKRTRFNWKLCEHILVEWLVSDEGYNYKRWRMTENPVDRDLKRPTKISLAGEVAKILERRKYNGADAKCVQNKVENLELYYHRAVAYLESLQLAEDQEIRDEIKGKVAELCPHFVALDPVFGALKRPVFVLSAVQQDTKVHINGRSRSESRVTDYSEENNGQNSEAEAVPKKRKKRIRKPVAPTPWTDEETDAILTCLENFPNVESLLTVDSKKSKAMLAKKSDIGQQICSALHQQAMENGRNRIRRTGKMIWQRIDEIVEKWRQAKDAEPYEAQSCPNFDRLDKICSVNTDSAVEKEDVLVLPVPEKKKLRMPSAKFWQWDEEDGLIDWLEMDENYLTYRQSSLHSGFNGKGNAKANTVTKEEFCLRGATYLRERGLSRQPRTGQSIINKINGLEIKWKIADAAVGEMQVKDAQGSIVTDREEKLMLPSVQEKLRDRFRNFDRLEAVMGDYWKNVQFKKVSEDTDAIIKERGVPGRKRELVRVASPEEGKDRYVCRTRRIWNAEETERLIQWLETPGNWAVFKSIAQPIHGIRKTHKYTQRMLIAAVTKLINPHNRYESRTVDMIIGKLDKEEEKWRKANTWLEGEEVVVDGEEVTERDAKLRQPHIKARLLALSRFFDRVDPIFYGMHTGEDVLERSDARAANVLKKTLGLARIAGEQPEPSSEIDAATPFCRRQRLPWTDWETQGLIEWLLLPGNLIKYHSYNESGGRGEKQKRRVCIEIAHYIHGRPEALPNLGPVRAWADVRTRITLMEKTWSKARDWLKGQTVVLETDPPVVAQGRDKLENPLVQAYLAKNCPEFAQINELFELYYEEEDEPEEPKEKRLQSTLTKRRLVDPSANLSQPFLLWEPEEEEALLQWLHVRENWEKLHSVLMLEEEECRKAVCSEVAKALPVRRGGFRRGWESIEDRVVTMYETWREAERLLDDGSVVLLGDDKYSKRSAKVTQSHIKAVILEKCPSYPRLDSIFSTRKERNDTQSNWKRNDKPPEDFSVAPPSPPPEARSRREVKHPRRAGPRSSPQPLFDNDVSEHFNMDTAHDSDTVAETGDDETLFREQLNKVYGDIFSLGQMWEKLQSKRKQPSTPAGSSELGNGFGSKAPADLLRLLTDTLATNSSDLPMSGNGLPQHLDSDVVFPDPPVTVAPRDPVVLQEPPMFSVVVPPAKFPGKLPIPRLRPQAPPIAAPNSSSMTFRIGQNGQIFLLNPSGSSGSSGLVLLPSSQNPSGPST